MTKGTVRPNGCLLPHGRLGGPATFARVAIAATLVAGIAATVSCGNEERGHVDPAPAGEAASQQTECPVMIGNKIDPDIYTDYRGKRVYFCCQSCKAAFARDPERYLARLPQFASVRKDAGHEEHEDHDRDRMLSFAGLAEPTGILTLSLVALTVCLGLLRRVRRLKPRLVLRLHKIFGVCALASGAVHATVVLLSH